MQEPWDSWRDVLPEDIEAVTRLLDRGEISIASGGILERFERRFAAFAGCRYAVSTTNGTSALHVALWALGVRAGDEVAVCDYGFHGIAAAVRSLGAVVVPVDAEPDGLTMDAADLGAALSDKTRAILVHAPWGIPADFAALRRAAPGIPIVADASHAHGARLGGKPLGAWADIACYSLDRGKQISGGELGCAATDQLDLRDRMLAYGHVNRVPQALKSLDWDGNAVGLKLRPHPVALALALGQLKRYETKLNGQRQWSTWLESLLEDYGFTPLRPCCESERVYWRVVGQAPPEERCGWNLSEVEAGLRRDGVPVEVNHYWPSLQFQRLFDWPDHVAGIRRRECPNVGSITPRLLTFPAFAAPVESATERFRAAFSTVFGNMAR
jgi:dTDP-4-amino-4,6-dideoxygalactose transaminase